MKNPNALRIAIIGAGPAGMYAAQHLLAERDLSVEIDIYERLPSPWGLVRAGVAPDHPEKKLVIDRLFSVVMDRPEVNFYGNIEIGKDIRVAELSEWYDGVIFSVGANSDTLMGIPGEELPGCWAAREFVSWYNGHPDFSHLQFDLSHERAVVVGNGNVALDVARILTTSPAQLEKTDMADHALEVLQKSAVREVVLLGRRGHFQGAFNNPELEELEHLEGVDLIIGAEDMPSDSEVILDDADWQTRRKVETLRRLAQMPKVKGNKRIVFRFLTSPVELLGDHKVEQLLVVRNHLDRNEDGKLCARPTEEETILDVGLVLRAIGYRGYPLAGLPFDERSGTIENTNGRVCDKGETLSGAYVTGWIKRGPRGVVGSNKKCAHQTVSCLLEDYRAGKLSLAGLSAEQVEAEIQQRKPDWVSKNQWAAIDRQERDQGKKRQKDRVKVCTISEMLSTAAQAKPISKTTVVINNEGATS